MTQLAVEEAGDEQLPSLVLLPPHLGDLYLQPQAYVHHAQLL